MKVFFVTGIVRFMTFLLVHIRSIEVLIETWSNIREKNSAQKTPARRKDWSYEDGRTTTGVESTVNEKTLLPWSASYRLMHCEYRRR